MVDWKNINKVRIHNRNESMKHFMVKAMVLKILFNEGYETYSEHEIFTGGRTRVADVCAKGMGVKLIIEVETNLTRKHKGDLRKFYENETLYIIELNRISMDIQEMEKQIRHILGM